MKFLLFLNVPFLLTSATTLCTQFRWEKRPLTQQEEPNNSVGLVSLFAKAANNASDLLLRIDAGSRNKKQAYNNINAGDIYKSLES
jgi:hypothetical protein